MAFEQADPLDGKRQRSRHHRERNRFRRAETGQRHVRLERARLAWEAERLQRVSDRLGKPGKASGRVVQARPDNIRASHRRKRTQRAETNGEVNVIPDSLCDRRRQFADALLFDSAEERHRQV